MRTLDPKPLIHAIERDQTLNGKTFTDNYVEFAERYGITNRTWLRIKDGRKRLRLHTVEAVAAAMHMHPSEIYGQAYYDACDAAQ